MASECPERCAKCRSKQCHETRGGIDCISWDGHTGQHFYGQINDEETP